MREVDNAMGLGNDRGRISLAMTVVKAMNP